MTQVLSSLQELAVTCWSEKFGNPFATLFRAFNYPNELRTLLIVTL